MPPLFGPYGPNNSYGYYFLSNEGFFLLSGSRTLLLMSHQPSESSQLKGSQIGSSAFPVTTLGAEELG